MKIVELHRGGLITYGGEPIKGDYPSRRTGEDLWAYVERLAVWCDGQEAGVMTMHRIRAGYYLGNYKGRAIEVEHLDGDGWQAIIDEDAANPVEPRRTMRDVLAVTRRTIDLGEA